MTDEDLIPSGWYRVNKGLTLAGDKYWSYEKMAWLPVTVNSDQSQRPFSEFAAVIRKES
jgi:hypothetical protein